MFPAISCVEDAVNVPSPFPSRIVTLPGPCGAACGKHCVLDTHVFTTARSILPSPLKSPATTPVGKIPGKLTVENTRYDPFSPFATISEIVLSSEFVTQKKFASCYSPRLPFGRRAVASFKPAVGIQFRRKRVRALRNNRQARQSVILHIPGQQRLWCSADYIGRVLVQQDRSGHRCLRQVKSIRGGRHHSVGIRDRNREYPRPRRNVVRELRGNPRTTGIH